MPKTHISATQAALAAGVIPRLQPAGDALKTGMSIVRQLALKKNRKVRDMLLHPANLGGGISRGDDPLFNAAQLLRMIYQSLANLAAAAEFAEHAGALERRAAAGTKRRLEQSGCDFYTTETAAGPIVVRVPLSKCGSFRSSLPLRAGRLPIGRIFCVAALLVEDIEPDRVAELLGELCGLELTPGVTAWLCGRLSEEHERFFGSGAASQAHPLLPSAPKQFWVRDAQSGRILTGADNSSCGAFLAKRRAAEKPSAALATRLLGESSWILRGKGIGMLSSELGEELAPGKYCEIPDSDHAVALLRLARARPEELVAVASVRGTGSVADLAKLLRLADGSNAVAAVLVANNVSGRTLRRLHEANCDSFPGSRAHFGLELVRVAGHLNTTLVKFRCVCGPSQSIPSRLWLHRKAELMHEKIMSDEQEGLLERLGRLRAGYRNLRGNRPRPHIGFRGRHLRTPLVHCDVCLETEPGEPGVIRLVYARLSRQQNLALCAQLLGQREAVGARLRTLGGIKWPELEAEDGWLSLEIKSRSDSDTQLLADIVAAERALLPFLRLHSPASFVV